MEYLYKAFTEDRKWLSQELAKCLEMEPKAPDAWKQVVLELCQDTERKRYADVWLRYFLVTALLIMEKFRAANGVQAKDLEPAKRRSEELMRKEKSDDCETVQQWAVHLRRIYGHS